MKVVISLTSIKEILGSHPIIAAVRNLEDLDKAINSPVTTIFLMCGDILSVKDVVDKAHKNDMTIFLHIELIKGVESDNKGIQYIAKKVRPNGIVTTKSRLIKEAKRSGLYAIQQLFLIDTYALNTSIYHIKENNPDAIELMPGLMPRIIRKVVTETSLPVIAGGLIHRDDEIKLATDSGAISCAIGQSSLWLKKFN